MSDSSTEKPLIKSTSYDQGEIINNIIALHCPAGIECDVTYSKGMFYKRYGVPDPGLKFDLHPQTLDTVQADACQLPLPDRALSSIMFDPPFVAGYTTGKATGKIGERFGGFARMRDVWDFYEKCLTEFARVIRRGGVLIVKCQDTMGGDHKQWFSHVHIINEARDRGFYCKDLFVLNAKNRLIGHNHAVQHHARKFHCYFLVFINKGA